MNALFWTPFFRFVNFAMHINPQALLWLAEKMLLVIPGLMRRVAFRYAQNHILACVSGGSLPFLTGRQLADAIMFYPLQNCERYELVQAPGLKPEPIFEGRMLAFIVPLEKRSRMYQVIGFAKDGRTYESGVLISHSDKTNTRMRPAAKVDNNRIEWRANTGRYLTSFILVHSGDHVHAAGYSQRMNWRYPDIRFFPHIVIPPDGTDLGQPGVSIMIMVVDKDAWVPEILVWGDVLKTES